MLRKKPKDEADLQFYNDMICASVEAFFATLNRFSLLQLKAFFLLLALAAHAHIDERGKRTLKRDEDLAKRVIGTVENYFFLIQKSGKLLSTQLLLKSENQRVDVKISKFVVGGIFISTCNGRICGGKKNQVSNDIVTH